MTTYRKEQEKFPPAFLTSIEDRCNTIPLETAKAWSFTSKYYFFLNGLTTPEMVVRYLRAQPKDELLGIALAFDIEDGSLTKDQLIYLISNSVTIE